MASRRTSSSRRRASAAAAAASRTPGSPGKKPGAAARRASRQLQIDEEGRALVSCPQCGNAYRIPEDKLDVKLVCRNCKRAFIPKVAGAGRRPRGRISYTPFVAGGIAVLAVVVIGVVIANIEGSGVQMAEQPEVVESVNIGLTNPRVQSVVQWVDAVHDGDEFAVLRRADVPALQAFLGIEPERPIPTLRGEERAAVEKRLLDEVFSGDRTRIFRHFEPAIAGLAAEAMASADGGVVSMELDPREGGPYFAKWEESGWFKGMRARVDFDFVMEDDVAKVTGWEVDYVPRNPEPRRRDTHVPHATISAPEEVQRKVGDETVTVKESKLISLDHLEDTPPEVRQEIDALIAKLLDLDLPGYVSNRCIDRLAEIGRPAIPRLLNQMYLRNQAKEVWSDEDKQAMRRVIQALTVMTGMRFNYNVADRTDLTVDGNREQRLSALRQWYAWWYEHHDRDYTEAIDKAEDESLFMTDAEKQALESSTRSDDKDD